MIQHASLAVAAALAASALLAGCKSDDPATAAVRAPAATNPTQAWRNELTAPMAGVIGELEKLAPKPLETLTPAEARRQPSAADAVMAYMKAKGMDTTPMPVGKMEDTSVPGPAGAIPVRVYTPEGAGPFPVIVYVHGGGWVIATVDTYDSSARALCRAANAIVVSVEYRKAPEHKFPAQLDDCYAVYEHVRANAATMMGDPAHVDVVGESAGGNMAVEIALRAKERGAKLPDHVVAVYPVADLTGKPSPSAQKYAQSMPLSTPALMWFGKQYLPSPADGSKPEASPILADLKGLPPTTVITAQIDPLMSQGKALADALKAAGVTTRYKHYDGVTHEFFGMGAVIPEAKDAVKFAADGLK